MDGGLIFLIIVGAVSGVIWLLGMFAAADVEKNRQWRNRRNLPW